MIQSTTKSSHSVKATQDHGNPRWVDYSRRSMQRLGFLKLVLRLASRPQTLESLTRAFAASITRVSPVLPEMMDSFRRYVQDQHLHKQRYSGEITSAQFQDLCLSDPILPSHSGAITGDLERKGYRHAVYVEIPTWAARLRLLRAQNYTVTDRGRVLLLLGEHSRESSDVGEKNPLYLSLSERYVALFCLLDADGDLLRAMYKQLLKRSKPFTRADAGDAAEKGLEELRRTRLKNASPGPLMQGGHGFAGFFLSPSKSALGRQQLRRLSLWLRSQFCQRRRGRVCQLLPHLELQQPAPAPLSPSTLTADAWLVGSRPGASYTPLKIIWARPASTRPPESRAGRGRSSRRPWHPGCV